MDVQENAVSVNPASASTRTPLQVRSPAVMAEVERLLAGRTRDIRLEGELHGLFETFVVAGGQDHSRLDDLGRFA